MKSIKFFDQNILFFSQKLKLILNIIYCCCRFSPRRCELCEQLAKHLKSVTNSILRKIPDKMSTISLNHNTNYPIAVRPLSTSVTMTWKQKKVKYHLTNSSETDLNVPFVGIENKKPTKRQRSKTFAVIFPSFIICSVKIQSQNRKMFSNNQITVSTALLPPMKCKHDTKTFN